MISPDALRLGPLLLPWSLLLVLAAIGVTLAVARRLGRTLEIDVEEILLRTLLVGLAVARFAYVYEFRGAYLAAPLDILDIRDGGWNPTAGFIGAWLYALTRQRRHPRLAKPLGWSMMAGTVLFACGMAVLSLAQGAHQRLPALSIASLDGPAVPLDRYMGKPTVVNLWATWCPPCVREMPVLQRAQAERPDVHFVFLNQGEPPQRVRAWLEERSLTLSNVLIDGKGQAAAWFNAQGYPTTLFFDAQGALVSTRVGELSAATLQERLKQIQRR